MRMTTSPATPAPLAPRPEQAGRLLSQEEIQAALARRERVRQVIGVVEKGFRPPSPEEFAEQLARRVPNDSE